MCGKNEMNALKWYTQSKILEKRQIKIKICSKNCLVKKAHVDHNVNVNRIGKIKQM